MGHVNYYSYGGIVMKRFFVVLTLFFSCVFLFIGTGCSSKKSTLEEEKLIPVKVITTKVEARERFLSYSGIVKPEETIKLSFKAGGKLLRIYAEEGQRIKKGQKLAEIDGKELELQVKGARTQMEAALAQYEKALLGAQKEDINKAKLNVEGALKAYEAYKEAYEALLSMLQNGQSVPNEKIFEAKMKMESSEIQLRQAREVLSQVQAGTRDEDKRAARAQYEGAKAQYDLALGLLNDRILYSNMEGYVVKILNATGEIVGPGYPVIVISSFKPIISVGLTSNDFRTVKEGTKVNINMKDRFYDGEVVLINKTPDASSGAYTIGIKPKTIYDIGEFILGSVVDVEIQSGEESGIWIPVSKILNNGEDYVFTIDGERAVLKNIRIIGYFRDMALVEGLNSGDKVVTEGMNNLKVGSRVEIRQ